MSDDAARAEAERRWELTGWGGLEMLQKRNAFMAGAAWQAAQPVAVSAEQWERLVSSTYGQIAAERCLTIMPGPDGYAFPLVPGHWRDMAEQYARNHLAALGIEVQP